MPPPMILFSAWPLRAEVPLASVLLLHSQRALVPRAVWRAAALGREGCELSAGSSRWSGV